MPTFNTTFTGVMVPKIITTPARCPECELSAVFADFNTATDYDFNLNVSQAALGDFLPASLGSAELRTSVQITNDENTLSWTLFTVPTTYTIGNPILLELDPAKSVLNGADNQGTINFNLSLTSGLTYILDGELLEAPINMPLNNGGSPLNVLLTVHLGGLTFTYTYTGVSLNTLLLTTSAVRDFQFSELSFKDGLSVNFKRPFNSSCLSGVLRFTNGKIVANLSFDAITLSDGTVQGVLNADANINDTPVISYITGNWSCSALTLFLTNGTVLDSCGDFLIPTYSTSIQGSITLTAS